MTDFTGWTHVSARWGVTIGQACWQGGLALVLALLICRLPRLSPRIQCWIWRLAYLKLLLTLFWTRPVNLPILPASDPAPLFQSSMDWSHPPVTPMPTVPTLPARVRSDGLPVMWTMLFALWAAGAVLRFSGAARDWRRLKWLRANCTALDDPPLIAECRELCSRLGLRRCPALLLQEGEGTPYLTGILRPAIILPRSFWADCTPDQRRLILAHELAHIRRGDLLWAWIPLVGRSLFFFLPPIWFAEREWQQSQEMACDEQVLWLAAGSRSDYGDLLLKVARQARPALLSGLAAVTVAGSYSTVRRRLLAMKHSGKTPRRTLAVAGTLVALVGAAVIVPWRVSAQDTEKKSKEILVRQGGDVLLEKQLIGELNLSDDQIRQTLAIGKAGALQILQLLTPEQRQRAAVGGGGWSDILASLNLNDAQEVRIKAFMEHQMQQMVALKADSTQTPEAREQAMKSIEQETLAQINETLTPQQEKQLAEALSQRKVDEDGLQLTEAQKARMSALKLGLGHQMEAINADNSLSKEQKAERLESLTRSMKMQLEQVLTPDQQRQLAAHEQQQRALRNNGPFHLVNLSRVENLTPDQQTRIQAAYAGVERQFMQLLSVAQQQKLQQLLVGESRAAGARKENASGG